MYLIIDIPLIPLHKQLASKQKIKNRSKRKQKNHKNGERYC